MDSQAPDNYKINTVSRGTLVAGAIYVASLMSALCALVG